MSDDVLVRHCAPTLAGLKTANMFMSPFKDRQSLRCEICRLNRILGRKGLRVIPLKTEQGKALIYIFRPERLRRDLRCGEAERVLRECGYNCRSIGSCLSHLRQRLGENGEFPHEIGLFLGYPPEDVCGFIQHRPCLMTGFWKVYSDAQGAEKKFRQYRKCMEVYSHRLAAGCPLEKLAVAS